MQDLRSMIQIPTPIVEMLTERLLVMSFIDGLPISKLKVGDLDLAPELALSPKH